jgi:hypothetical protein
MPLKDIPEGGYLLIMQAVDAAGNHAASRSIFFELTN